jgi:type IV secretion system protein VirB10
MSFGRKSIIVIGGLSVAGLLVMLTPSGFHQKKSEEDIGGAAGGSPGAIRRFEPLPKPDFTPPAATPASLPNPERVQGPLPRRLPVPQRSNKAANLMAWEDRNHNRDTEEQQSGGAAGNAIEAAASGGGPAEEEDALAARLKTTRTEPTKARRLKHPELTLTMGTIIPCTPQQPLNTQLPGFISCRVPTAVFGSTGTVPLLDEGTKIVGQIQKQLDHGQNRAFILWTRAETPDGVTVELGSPGTDARGQNGMPVEVHTNFWQRFGGAILLSFIDAGLQFAAIGASNALSNTNEGNGNNNISLYSLRSGGRSAASTALNQNGNIPPYGTAEAGEPAAVFVARDISFADVYRLRKLVAKPTQPIRGIHDR